MNAAATETKHTPGPWEVHNGCNVVAPGAHLPLTRAGYIAVTGGLSGTDTIDRDAANARLIAAAPELLAVAARPVVYEIEESEGTIRLSFGGVEVCAHPDGTPQAAALLAFAAEQRCAIAKATKAGAA